MTRTNGERRRDELADRRLQRNVTVVNVERRFGLVDATPPRQGEDVNDQHRYDQARESRRQQKPGRRERVARPQKIDTAPVDGKTEANYRQP